MHNHDSLVALRWFWVAFIALFGLLLLIKPKFLAVDALRFGLRRLKNDQQERAVRALERRLKAEHVSTTPGYIGGAGALVIAAAGALTSLQPVVLYALFCFWLAAITAITFVQLRNGQPKRVAVLAPRSSATVIPRWIALGTLLSVLTPLVYAAKPQYTLACIVVCCSALVTLAVAWRLTQLPALLQGQDLPAEVFIDNRLRAQRTAGPLMLAVVQPLVFLSYVSQENGIEFAAMALTAAAFVSLLVWSLRCLYQTPALSAV
jgi:hypothetical protein